MKLGIIKKWLEALRGETFTEQTFSFFFETFKSIITRNLSADSMRSLALYITYATHKPSQKTSLPLRVKSVKLNTSLSSRRKTLGSPSPESSILNEEQTPRLTGTQIALRMLDLYADLLCQKGDFANIHKFARTVTNKASTHLHSHPPKLTSASGFSIFWLITNQLWSFWQPRSWLGFWSSVDPITFRSSSIKQAA